MRRFAPTLIGIAVAFVHVALIVRAALHHTGGEFGYAVDDAYIHLAIAKHVAFDGVYGITRYAFAAASSSVLWPWLLAGAMRAFGNQLLLPLFLNLAAAAALVVIVGRALRREAPTLSPLVQTLVIVAIVLLMPLATLVVVGMEHVLQAALTTAFVLEAARVIEAEETLGEAWPLLPLAAAMVGTRYEGLFPAAIAVALLVVRRRFGLAAAIAAAAAAPVLLFGAYSVAHGSLFFPNSVELKRQHLKLEELSDFGDVFGGNVLNSMSTQPFVLPLGFGTCGLLAVELSRRRAWTAHGVRLVLAFGTTIAHLELASVGCFFRYEAYLVPLDLTVIAIAMASVASTLPVREMWQRSPWALLAGAGAVAVGLAPLGVRAITAASTTPTACGDIHDQQIQTARFLARYFPHDLVAVNDIGAVAYYGDEPIIDLEGLADPAIAEQKSFRLDTPLDARQLASLTANAPIAVIYDEWFPKVPRSWVRLGRLRLDYNTVCASSTVAVYATSGEHVPRVLSALRAFQPSLPASLNREGIWVDAPPDQGGPWRAASGDVLSIDTSLPGLTSVEAVNGFGSISLPRVGEVRVRDLRSSEIGDAIRTAGARRGVPIPASADVRVTRIDEHRCRVLVSGNVARAIDEQVDCGTSAEAMLARAGSGDVQSVDPYIWRQEGGSVRRIVLDDNPANERFTGAVPMRDGDILIVE